MAVPEHQLETFLPSELHFLAENETVGILPRQPSSSLPLVSGQVPEMRSMRRVDVPLWLAMTLKKQRRCQIIPPDWMEEKNLQRILAHEQNFPDSFATVDWHWLEIAQILLAGAADDLTSSPHVLRNLVRDIREIRESKARVGMHELNESLLQMDGMGLMEINELRPFVTTVMDKMTSVHAATGLDEMQVYSESDNSDDDVPLTQEGTSSVAGDDSVQAVHSSQLDSSLRYGQRPDDSEASMELAQWDDN